MDKNDLMPDYLLLEDAAEYLHATKRKITLFRKHGLLKFGKLGRSYVYRKQWLDDFMDSWSGYDLSNENRIKAAIQEKAWRQKHGY